MANFKRVVNVIPLKRVNLGSPQIFTYLVPLQLQGLLRPGQVVKVPFGQQRETFGVVSSMEMHRLPAETRGLKNLAALHDAAPYFTEKNLALVTWLAENYLAPLGVAAKAMMPKPVKKMTAPAAATGLEKFNPDFVLTENQREALNQITAAAGRPRTFLIHGPRGAGKTEVCLQAISRILESGGQIIFLVPEMGLLQKSRQLLARRFGMDKVALLHSDLSGAERLHEWRKIMDGEKLIILGTRSAIFAPVRKLGAIIMEDEYHSSYKQYDQQPKYDARRVARKLSAIWRCPLLLTSASPSVEAYYETAAQKAGLLPLPNPIKADQEVARVKLAAVPGDHAISPALAAELTRTLLKNHSALLVFDRALAGKMADELQSLVVEEFRRARPRLRRLSPAELLVEPEMAGDEPRLVAVLDADFYLRWSDLRAAERAYVYLSSLQRRVGPGPEPGVLLLQTANPEHYVMRALRAGDYNIFFREEIARRKAEGSPPFSRLIKIASGKKVIRVLKMPADATPSYSLLPKDLPRNADIDVDPESLI